MIVILSIVISDQITLHLFQPHQADQMYDPYLMDSSQQAYSDVNGIMLRSCVSCEAKCRICVSIHISTGT